MVTIIYKTTSRTITIIYKDPKQSPKEVFCFTAKVDPVGNLDITKLVRKYSTLDYQNYEFYRELLTELSKYVRTFSCDEKVGSYDFFEFYTKLKKYVYVGKRKQSRSTKVEVWAFIQ